jgi:hypothetical protein
VGWDLFENVAIKMSRAWCGTTVKGKTGVHKQALAVGLTATPVAAWGISHSDGPGDWKRMHIDNVSFMLVVYTAGKGVNALREPIPPDFV